MLRLLDQQLDYVAFLGVALLALFFVCVRIRRVPARRMPQTVLVLFGVVLLLGWPLVDAIGSRPQKNIQRILANVAPSAALLMEQGGHEAITADSPPDDQRYRALVEIQERFLAGTPNIVGISTLRMRSDGRIEYLVRARKRDADSSAVFDASVSRGNQGEIVEDVSPAMRAALGGDHSPEADMVEVLGARWVVALAPIRRSDGALDGAVGVDFDAGLWTKSRRMYRAGGIALVAMILSVVAVSGYTVASVRNQLQAVRMAEAQSRVTENRLRQIVDALEDAVILTDDRGQITSWNHRAAEMFAWDRPGPVGQAIGSTIAPGSDCAGFADGLTRLLQSRACGHVHEHLEFKRILADGASMVADVTITTIAIEGHRQYVVSVRDITARRRSEEDIRELTGRFERSEKFGHLGTWDIDFATESITASARALTILGFDRDVSPLNLGRLVDRFHPDDIDRYRAALWRAAEEGADYSTEIRIILADGTTRHVQMRGQPRRDELGRVNGLIGTVLDVTELTEANTAARVGQRQFESIFQSAASGLLVTDGNRRVTLANERMEEILQRARARLVGLHVDVLFQESGLLPPSGAWVSTLSGGRSLRLRGERLGGRIFFGELHVREIDTLSGRGLIVQVDDTTARETSLQEDLRAQRMASIGTLSAGIAHDLNNALAPISMGVELLRMRFPEQRAILDLIGKSAGRTADLVKQLLAFARGTQGERRQIKSRTVIEEMSEIIARTFPREISLRLEIGPTGPVIGDHTQLHQVLLNLCVNARDAMPAGGELLIGAGDCELDGHASTLPEKAPPGRYVKWWVRDEGTGIPQEILDRIFDPFFTTKAQGKGTGLGLSTVLGIVRGHGGYLNVITAPEAGTTFEIFLPVAVRNESESTAGIAPVGPSFRGNGELILVVDDEQLVREITRTVLVDLNFRVLVAANGAEGLRLLERHRKEIAVVITDLQMPGMNGIQFMDSAKSILPLAKIVVTSGYLKDSEVNDLGSSGVAAVLVKPFTHASLIDVLIPVLPPLTGTENESS